MAESSRSSSWVFPPPQTTESPPHSFDSPPRPGRRRIVTWLVGLVLVGVGIQTVGLVWRNHSATEVVNSEVDQPPPSPEGEPGEVVPAGESAGAPSLLVVHVVGQVERPGIVELAPGSRVADALLQAGGPSPDADVSQVNLARAVLDGEQIRVPAVGEEVSGTGNGPGGAGSPSSGVISLSRADVATLEDLPGIGPVLAQRIVDWGIAHGGFQVVEDVLAIPGIGPSTLDLFRHLVIP